MSNNWSDRVSDSEAARRAGGRARWNAVRQVRRELRRVDVAKLMRHYGLDRGSQTAIARCLGVSRSTVCRDVRAILAEMNEGGPCPICGMDWSRPVECVRERLLRWP